MGSAVRRGVAVALVLAAIAEAALLAAAGPGGGFERIAVVRGHSMEPLFHTGDLVFLVKPPPERVRVGDVVVYRRGATYVIHRVVYAYSYAGGWCYVVWGDNRATNPIPDPGDPLHCGRVVFRDPVSGDLVEASGIPYSSIVGVVLSVRGFILKIPYLGGLALLTR